MIIAIRVRNLNDDTELIQATTLDSTDKEKSEEETFELGLSSVKRRQSILLSVGRKFLSIVNKDEEKGVMHLLRESVKARHDTFSVFLT